jgi:hypothetical protein
MKSLLYAIATVCVITPLQVLRTSNSGVVLAVVKCFLHITESMPDIQAQVRIYLQFGNSRHIAIRCRTASLQQ